MLLDLAHIAAKNYKVSAVPTTFFIDRQGAARKMVSGRMQEDELEGTLGELL